jgi:hypothetical protein
VRAPEPPPFCGCRQLTCATVDREAVSYFFNGLSAKRRTLVRAHLSQCHRCQVKLDVFASVWIHHGQQAAEN